VREHPIPKTCPDYTQFGPKMLLRGEHTGPKTTAGKSLKKEQIGAITGQKGRKSPGSDQ